jgi:hypothetical protein
MTSPPDPAPKREAFLPVQASDFVITVGGREARWLSRLVGLVAAPIARRWIGRARARGEWPPRPPAHAAPRRRARREGRRLASRDRARHLPAGRPALGRWPLASGRRRRSPRPDLPMSDTAVALVRRAYAAYAAFGVASVFGLLHPEVEIVQTATVGSCASPPTWTRPPCSPPSVRVPPRPRPRTLAPRRPASAASRWSPARRAAARERSSTWFPSWSPWWLVPNGEPRPANARRSLRTPYAVGPLHS